MRLTVEMVLQDNKRFEKCNALAELKYCGWEVPHRKSITNDEIRFHAWLFRSAVALLKEQEPIKPTINECGEAYCVCGENVGIIPDSKNLPKIRSKYCPECGRRMKWEC